MSDDLQLLTKSIMALPSIHNQQLLKMLFSVHGSYGLSLTVRFQIISKIFQNLASKFNLLQQDMSIGTGSLTISSQIWTLYSRYQNVLLTTYKLTYPSGTVIVYYDPQTLYITRVHDRQVFSDGTIVRTVWRTLLASRTLKQRSWEKTIILEKSPKL